jgi:regulator of cell morphogenesis and NO signaling
MSTLLNETLASIVTRNHHSVAILEKYNLDFCCNGKRTLEEACKAKSLTAAEIEAELSAAITPTDFKQMPFTEMTAEQLISHIIVKHHFYVKQIIPQLYGHLQKVANKHGERFPYMCQVAEIFSVVAQEMTSHMQKEEQILFPRIKQIENATNSAIPDGFIDGPIGVMEAEHEQVGDALYEIRSLTNNYIAPEGACNTFKIALAELKEFEEDLHQHVHLENNILFPLAYSKLGFSS